MTESAIVFTNGCFDIIHKGHVELLEFAATKGRVVVGLNSDASVRKLKGVSRPINSEQDRKKVLEALKSVSEVIIFEEETPLELITKIKPQIIIKGGDYKAEDVVGSGLAEVIIFPYVSGKSTTSIIEKINSNLDGA